MLKEIKKHFKKESDKDKAKILQKFFKTGKGEYAEGDLFLGIVVPKQRKIAKQFSNLPLIGVGKLLDSNVHEYRLTALLILDLKYKKANKEQKKEIFNFYFKYAKKGKINNWDLVDLSAPNILGSYLLEHEKEKGKIYSLARSKNLWEKRIAILSTFAFIRKGKFNDTIKISEILLRDKHDLIHKAVGWMLREIGKKDKKELVKFLNKYKKNMARTTLRYAIEKLSDKERKFYLGKI